MAWPRSTSMSAPGEKLPSEPSLGKLSASARPASSRAVVSIAMCFLMCCWFGESVRSRGGMGARASSPSSPASCRGEDERFAKTPPLSRQSVRSGALFLRYSRFRSAALKGRIRPCCREIPRHYFFKTAGVRWAYPGTMGGRGRGVLGVPPAYYFRTPAVLVSYPRHIAFAAPA